MKDGLWDVSATENMLCTYIQPEFNSKKPIGWLTTSSNSSFREIRYFRLLDTWNHMHIPTKKHNHIPLIKIKLF